MPVDHGSRGAASAYYGTGESEQFQRSARDNNDQVKAYQEGRQQAYRDGASAPAPYNNGLKSQSQELRNASMFRAVAVRRVRAAQDGA